MDEIKHTSTKTENEISQDDQLVDSLNLKYRPFPLVGIGGSAGSLSAIQEFLEEIPIDSGIAFVMVQHLDPSQPSILDELLQRNSKIPVLRVEDGMEVKPDHFYVIPENKEMVILNGHLLLMQPNKPRGRHMPIDNFLHSLASDWGEKAICAIFSGMGSDGEMGARFIKEGLGLVMVQTPENAQYESMPRSVIEMDNPDFIETPRAMAQKLLQYVKSPLLQKSNKDDFTTKEISTMEKIFALLRKGTGHDFTLYKKNTVLRRLERRMRMHQFTEPEEYVQYLQQFPNEVQVLFKEILIGVTKFFRDYAAFEILEKQVLPGLIKGKNKNESLRIWVAGCSSGEEVYSLAILVAECLDKMNLRKVVRVQMFATDLDAEAIKRTRMGVYPENVSNDISAERLERWFIKKNNTYQVVQEIREMVVCAEHNMIKDASFTKLDLLCCRNVLIYFTAELQRKLMPLFHYTLREGGVLFLGPSETINGFEDLFTSVDSKWKIFRRRENSMAHTRFIEFPAQMAAIKHLRFTGAEDSMSVKGLNRAESLPEKINKLLLQKHTPPSLVVNHKGDVVFIHGRTGKYLEPAPGHFISNAFEMAREGLQLELRGAVLRASTQAGPVILERVNVKTNGHYQLVKLTVEQISKPDELNGLFLVTFEDLPEIKKPSRKKGKEAINPEHNQIIEQLEQELAFTREHLQHTIEQMQSTVEELKSANEELQSTNEELQSTNEESNTAKEEMQALNEELMTVNTQARSKTEELTELNNDITNLLNSSEIYTLFLSNHLHIKRFTPYVTKIIPLVQSDIGRPITNFSSNLKYQHLISDINEVLARLTQKEIEVESANGNWYMLRIVPYRTLDNFIRGVVLSFKEVTPVKQLQKQLAGANEFAADLLNAIKEAALVLNSLFQVIAVNHIFLEYFQLAEEQLIDRNFFNLGNGRWNTEALREAMEEVLHGKQITEDYQVGRPFGGLGLKPMKLHARRLRRGEDHCILVTLEEIQ